MMNEEKLRFPEMNPDGKGGAGEGSASRTGANRHLRVMLSDSTGFKKTDVKIPINLIKIATKFAGMSFIPEEARAEMSRNGIDLAKLDFQELVGMIDEGLSDGRLVDIDFEDHKDGKTRVEIFVD